MQFVSVLSISRRIRSCSAAISTLAILHVDPDSSELRRSEPSARAALLTSHSRELQGSLDFVTE